MLLWIILGILAVLLVAGLAAGSPAKPRQRAAPLLAEEDFETPLEMLERDAPGALARYGTAETAQWLIEQGRGDELHGLGYRGPKE